jgi:hypothetical protein
MIEIIDHKILVEKVFLSEFLELRRNTFHIED